MIELRCTVFAKEECEVVVVLSIRDIKVEPFWLTRYWDRTTVLLHIFSHSSMLSLAWAICMGSDCSLTHTGVAWRTWWLWRRLFKWTVRSVSWLREICSLRHASSVSISVLRPQRENSLQHQLIPPTQSGESANSIVNSAAHCFPCFTASYYTPTSHLSGMWSNTLCPSPTPPTWAPYWWVDSEIGLFFVDRWDLFVQRNTGNWQKSLAFGRVSWKLARTGNESASRCSRAC